VFLQRVRKDSRTVGVQRKSWGEVRDTLFLVGGGGDITLIEVSQALS
jgi:hypothetical protein